jgi:small subunit ribosomal protein S17
MAEKKKTEKAEKPAAVEAEATEAEVTKPVAEETPAPEAEATEVSDTEVSDTSDATPEPEAVAEVEEVSDTKVSDTAVEEAEEVSDTKVSDTAEVAPEPTAPAKKQRSGRHVPRTERRTRTKVVREKPKKRKPITRTEKPEGERGRRQERRGVVVSDKGDKTIIVKVDLIKSHPRYKKVVRSTVRFHAHDEENTAGVGDTVRIIETRPLSKLKRWRLAEIVEKAR